MTTTIKVIPPWEPIIPGFVCTEDCRSPEHLVRAFAQHAVQCCHRYDQGTPNPGDTHCNCYVWDCTSSLQAEIPHWIDMSGGSVKPFAPGAKELSANAQASWLRAFGTDHGWEEIVRGEANTRTAHGLPVVITYYNQGVRPDGSQEPGHIAMALPPLPGEPEVVRIAQAGRENLWDVPLERGFGHLQVQFWTHQ